MRKYERIMGGVSLVVPAYNVSDVIERCVESVRCSTYTNWELIIVDDGSKDETAQICNRLQQEDSRIRFVKNEQNRGVSFVRNKGIELAEKEYLVFLDSDDALMPDALDMWLASFEKTIIAVQMGFMNNEILHEGCDKDYTVDDFLKDANRNKRLYYLSRWMFRTDAIKGKIAFRENLPMGEDTVFLLDFLLRQQESIIRCKKEPSFIIIGKSNSATSSFRKNLQNELDELYRAKKVIYSTLSEEKQNDLAYYTAEHNLLISYVNILRSNYGIRQRCDIYKAIAKTVWFSETEDLQIEKGKASLKIKVLRALLKNKRFILAALIR